MKWILRKMLAVILVLAPALPAMAQRVTVSGHVTDLSSGEPIIGAAIIDKSSTQGCVTGNTGFYSISLSPGEKTLVVSCLGYGELVQTVDLKANLVLDLKLSQSLDNISEAVVTAHTGELGPRGTQMSAIEVPISQIKTIPAIGGEVDVIKALQLLPGVQSGTEGTAGIYVRGGGADENLLLMDGVPLYNVNHLFGFFSVFNADALKNVTLYKGSFPARFGGHLSSVIDVRMNDGNDREYHGSASIGLISSKFNFEGPIVKGRTTFNISARRTYMDLLAKPLIAYANKQNKEDDGNYSKSSGGYDFYDLNVKLTHRFRNNDRLSLCVYTGDDKAHVGYKSSNEYEIMEYQPDISGYSPSGTWSISRQDMDFAWSWGNLLSSLRWSHVITPKLHMEAGVSYTRYRSNMNIDMTEYDAVREGMGSNPTEVYNAKAGVNYLSLINDTAANADFSWHPNPFHDVKFGAGYTYHIFKPGIISLKSKISEEDFSGGDINFKVKVGDKPLYSHESAIYMEDNWTALSWLKLNVGFRASMYNVGGKTYLSAEPRLSTRALVTDKLSLKASYSEMSQYIHLLCNSSLSLPSDLWVPVTKNIRPMRSRQVAGGVFYDLGKFDLSAEVYYKNMNNVLEYKDGASYLGTSTGWEEKVNQGRGWSYGLELFVQKKIGKTTGWIGYTLSKSMRQFDREGQMINDGNPFPAKYDRRHDLSMTITHRFSKKFDLSATFVYASGNCGSLGYDEFRGSGISGVGGNVGFVDGSVVTYIPYRNNYRLPSYNRMDVGMNFYRQHRRGQGIWNISVYNVYNRLNPFMIITDYVFDGYDEETGYSKNRPALKKLSIFPIIPAVSYTYKF